jgi:hypothetical protein
MTAEQAATLAALVTVATIVGAILLAIWQAGKGK